MTLPIIQSDSATACAGAAPRPAAARAGANSSRPAKGTYAFISLGCPKNLVDSERMLGLLELDGYRLVADPQGTDFVVVNTCGFIERAREESYGAIQEMIELKRRGGTKGIIV
ncbi:MAG: 30S ribosomal protein S12 methylthiotransferase RimO, partial [Pirellulales bacterium]